MDNSNPQNICPTIPMLPMNLMNLNGYILMPTLPSQSIVLRPNPLLMYTASGIGQTVPVTPSIGITDPPTTNVITSTARKETISPTSKSKNKDKPFQCEECSKTFKHAINLKIHKKIHTSDAFICGFCSKAFARKTNLRQHERVHS